ncbi:hypothetical protein B0T13DRAFT_446138 [Neurospora crassa]|nr:hypothetical protein B0T13DRAFT_446138 [Neurospora crassa]
MLNLPSLDFFSLPSTAAIAHHILRSFRENYIPIASGNISFEVTMLVFVANQKVGRHHKAVDYAPGKEYDFFAKIARFNRTGRKLPQHVYAELFRALIAARVRFLEHNPTSTETASQMAVQLDELIANMDGCYSDAEMSRRLEEENLKAEVQQGSSTGGELGEAESAALVSTHPLPPSATANLSLLQIITTPTSSPSTIMSYIKREASDRKGTISTPATSFTKTSQRETETLTSTTPTTPTTDPDPSPSQLLDLPTLTDTFSQVADKLSALASVVAQGGSIAVATGCTAATVAERNSIPGASTTLSLAEVAELRTIRRVLDTATEVHARVRREMRQLSKQHHKSSEIVRGRLVSLQAKNPRSKHHRRKFRGGRIISGRADSNIAAGAGGLQLPNFGADLIPKKHRGSVEDLLRGTGLGGVQNSTSTPEGSVANGKDAEFSPDPAQTHKSSDEGGQ